MNFDTFSLAAMATELRSMLLGGRVQRVTQTNSLIFGFEIYLHPIRHYLIISAEPQAPRLFLTSQKTRRGAGNNTPLMLVLRKYMRGAILKTIEQPPYERILHFDFESPFGTIKLVAEMLGTRSNLVLLEADQSILGVARLPKMRGDQPQQRLILPGHFYQAPPQQHKPHPPELTELLLEQELGEASPKLKLARLLPNIVTGVSPLLAREIVFRATGSTGTTVNQITSISPLLDSFRQLFDHFWHERWQPTLAVDDDEVPLAFAPYPLQHLAHTRPTESLSVAAETFYTESAVSYAAAKAPLEEAIRSARQRLDRRRTRLSEDAESQANPIGLKQKGETILAYAHQIQPGQKVLIADWPGSDSASTISLDPSLSASENAQQYFSRYRKAQRAGDEIPAQLKTLSLAEKYLEQLEQDLVMAENRPEIDTVGEALREAGHYRPKRMRKRQKSAGSHYLRLTAPDGATIWVGKNAAQNAHLTFSRAGPDDLWLHARGIPGAHVIIPTAQGVPDEEDVFWAAGVAAFYSRGRHDTSVEVDVTLKKYVRAIKGSAPGLVTYRNESTFRVAPIEPDPGED